MQNELEHLTGNAPMRTGTRDYFLSLLYRDMLAWNDYLKHDWARTRLSEELIESYEQFRETFHESEHSKEAIKEFRLRSE